MCVDVQAVCTLYLWLIYQCQEVSVNTIRSYTHAHTRPRPRTHARKHTSTHASTHARTQARTHARTHAHTRSTKRNRLCLCCESVSARSTQISQGRPTASMIPWWECTHLEMHPALRVLQLFSDCGAYLKSYHSSVAQVQNRNLLQTLYV